MNGGNIVELSNITKVFPGVKALDNVNFTLQKGSVHALVGENGAGKSTLMKILSGSYAEYEGRVIIDGEEVHFKSERDALDAGIAIVPQELNPIPELTIAENIFIGREPVKKIPGVIDKKKRSELTRQLMSYIGLSYDPETKMAGLSVAQKQMVEIIKAISRNSRVIIMDEPTSALTDVEIKYLIEQINLLKEKGISIIFISHKLEEVFRICDTITVLRDGQFIGTMPVGDVTADDVIPMMVGRKMKDIYPAIAPPQEEAVLEVKGLSSRGVFDDISFSLRKGEILGFAGMMGSGRSEIASSIFGLDSQDGGEIILEGKPLNIRCPEDAIKSGIVMVTEDRATYGFVGVRSIKDNITLPNCDMFAPRQLLKRRKIEQSVKDICEVLSVKAPSIETLVSSLSGGNQQKIVLAKWLVRNVKVLIMDEPTRGIDVGAKQEIYTLIAKLAAQGLSIIMISSEMPEVLAMSHRLLVISDGRIAGELTAERATQNEIMRMIVSNGKKEQDEVTNTTIGGM